MEDELVVPAEEPAPELEVTATPEPVAEAPVETPDEKQPAKTFTQEDLDAAIGKRLAREQRRWERESQQRIAEAVPKPADDLRADQFASAEDYAEASARPEDRGRDRARRFGRPLAARVLVDSLRDSRPGVPE